MLYLHTTGDDKKPYKIQLRAEIIKDWRIIGGSVIIEFKSEGLALVKAKKQASYDWTFQKPISEIENWDRVGKFLNDLDATRTAAVKKERQQAPPPEQQSLF